MVLPADFAAKISLLTSTGKQVAIEAGRTAVDGAARPHNRTDREGRLSTHTGSSLRLPSTAGLGSLAAVQIAAADRVEIDPSAATDLWLMSLPHDAGRCPRRIGAIGVTSARPTGERPELS